MEEFLDLLGKAIVKIVRAEMLTPRMRYTKRGNIPKGTYNFTASGNLLRSVSYVVMDEEILILMEDYGVQYVFSDLAAATGGEGGSWPGGGKYYPDRRPPGARGKYSPLLEKLEKWVNDKLQIRGAQAKSIAFAVRTNLFKAGYKGLPLFTQEVNDLIAAEMDKLLQDDRFAETIVRQEILDKLEYLRVLGKEEYNLAIGL